MSDNPDDGKNFISTVRSGILKNDMSEIAKFFANSDIPPPSVIVDPQPELIKDERLCFLYDYWSGLPRPTGIPNASDIDAVNMAPALGFISLMDVLDDQPDFRYRVFGSTLAGLFGYDMTGKLTSEHPGPQETARFFVGAYQATIILRRPVLTRQAPPPGIAARWWTRIILPLDNGEGAVDRLLVGNAPVGWQAGTQHRRI